MLGGRMIPGQGGLPVYEGDTIIGAVGVSGGTPQEDENYCICRYKFCRKKLFLELSYISLTLLLNIQHITNIEDDDNAIAGPDGKFR